MKLCAFLPVLLALLSPAMAGAEAVDLRTLSEKSAFKRTGRYAEVVELCADFARSYPDSVRCETFGTTPEGRPMKVLIASRSGALTPEAARKHAVPVVFFEGGIHAGEIDGKDAGFLALRQMLDGEAARGALEKVVMVFVPVFNVDGHERFKAWNRPNQRGPEEMGWRTTSQNLNLNRDWAKADAPEMQALLKLLNAWDPIAFADLHATDGAQFEHDISIIVEPQHAGDPAMRRAGAKLRDVVFDELTRQGSLPVKFYPSFNVYDDPSSGFTEGVAPPRFSTAYVALRNRFSMLVETHSWRDYPTRVRITRNTIIALTALTAAEGRNWRKLADAADRKSAQLAGASVPITWAASDKQRMIEFRGYAYTRTPSEVSGSLMTRYDETRPQVWTVPLRDEVLPSVHARLPGFAYLVPAGHAAWMSERLTLHGVRFERLTGALEGVSARAFAASKAEPAPQSFEGRQRLTLEGDWQDHKAHVAEGSLIVPVTGNNANLLAALLDPRAPDSFAAWGFFNNHFEGKEYMEPYVAEAIAREMMAADPGVAEAFNARLASDPAFAADPQARLDFFYRRHSSWDSTRDVYPVLMLDAPISAR